MHEVGHNAHQDGDLALSFLGQVHAVYVNIRIDYKTRSSTQTRINSESPAILIALTDFDGHLEHECYVKRSYLLPCASSVHASHRLPPYPVAQGVEPSSVVP